MSHRSTIFRPIGLVALVGLLFSATPAAALTITLDKIGAVTGSTFTADSRLLGDNGKNVDHADNPHIISIKDCEAIKSQKSANGNATVTFTWSWKNALNEGWILNQSKYSIKVAAGSGTCDSASLDKTTNDATCLVLKNSTTMSGSPISLTFDIDLNELLKDVTCGSKTDSTATVYFLVTHADLNGINGGTQVSTTPTSTQMQVQIDLTPPAAPTIESVSSGNQNVKVSWKHADETTKKAKVYWSELAFKTDGVALAEKNSGVTTASSFQITDLTNDKTYYVAVTAFDDAENESDAKEVLETKPIPVQDLWQYYKASGGASEGGYYGCQAGSRGGSGGGVGWLIALAVLVLMLARRRRAAGIATAVAAVLAVGAVFAPTTAQAESPRTMSVDLRFGYYMPAIDSEFADNGTGKTPYGDVLKESALHRGLTLDWLVFDGFGELSFGFGVGYWEQEGKGQSYTGENTDDTTSMTIVPLTIDASYRFTVLAERFNFPLVPYGRVGLAYGLWWINDGLGNTAKYTDADGRVFDGQGGVAGLHWSAGLRLLLDVFEPQAAKGFDMEMGVNHSYLFVEFQRMSLTNFGDSKVLDLSDDIIHFGLAFDL